MLTVAVLAAKYFQNHYERALNLLIRLGYVSRLSVSRFNRQLHKLRDWFYGMVCLVGEVFSQGEAFIIESLPLPESARERILRLLCCQRREILWLALASGLHHRRNSREFQLVARCLSRFDPGA
jgi:hypothetical protein